MPDYLGDEMRKVKKDEPEKEETKEIKCKFKKNNIFSHTYSDKFQKYFWWEIRLPLGFLLISIIPKLNEVGTLGQYWKIRPISAVGMLKS